MAGQGYIPWTGKEGKVEHISKVLKGFPPGTDTPDPKILEEDNEDTLEVRRESLRCSLNVSDLSNTFENWKPWPGAESCYKAFQRFATVDNSPPLLAAYGGVGNGKTYFLEATAIELYKRGIYARRLVFRNIFESLMDTMKRDNSEPSSSSYSERLERVCKVNILLIDDIGMGSFDTEKSWSLQCSILEAIIVHRYHEKLKTAIITNMDFVQLPERVVSRFQDSALAVLVLNEGEDYRPEKRKGVR